MTTTEAIEYARKFREFISTHRLSNLPASARLVESLDHLLNVAQDPSAQRRRDFEAGLTVECDGRLSDGRWEFNGQIYNTRDALVAAYLNE